MPIKLAKDELIGSTNPAGKEAFAIVMVEV